MRSPPVSCGWSPRCVGVVLGFADAASLPLDDPTLWSQFTDYVWTLETLRVAIISALVAAAATTVAAMSLQRKGIAAAAFLAIGALLPLALAGHAAGTADHETAVNTIAAHLVGASLWVGGLLAVVLLRPAMGRHLPVVVGRYSTMALWCFVAVAVSGVVSAVIRLGGIGDLGNLATAYGALVLVKTTCLVVLGLLGWQQRRRVVGRMTDGSPARGLFLRFAVTELLVMGVAVGFATALARTPTPASPGPLDTSASAQLTGYPAPAAPTATTWLTLWRFDWLWGVLAIIAVGVYVMWVIRLRRRGDHWSPLRLVWWVVGWLVLVWATCGAPGVLGRVSFSWHMVEHMTIAMYAPMFLVLAAPISLALRALPARGDGSLGPRELVLGLVHSRLLRVVGNPVVASALFFVSLVVFYYSPLFGLALTTHTGHVLMTDALPRHGVPVRLGHGRARPRAAEVGAVAAAAHPAHHRVVPRVLRGRPDERDEPAGARLLRGDPHPVDPRPGGRPAGRRQHRVGGGRDPGPRAQPHRGPRLDPVGRAREPPARPPGRAGRWGRARRLQRAPPGAGPTPGAGSPDA